MAIPDYQTLMRPLLTYDILAENLTTEEYSLLVPITHYSYRISKEEYRKAVGQQILRAQQGRGVSSCGSN